MRDDTKLARVRAAMVTGDWDAALKAAAKFQRLGEHEEAIRRAANAVNNPRFYEQLGHDVDALRAAGVQALKVRFDKSWKEVSGSTKNREPEGA